MKKFMYFIGAGATKCCGVPDTSTFLRMVHSVNPNDPEGLALNNEVKELYEFIKNFYEKIYGKTDLEYIYTKTIDYCNNRQRIMIQDIDQNYMLLRNFEDSLRMENGKLISLEFNGNIKDKIIKDQKLCNELRKQLEKLIYYFYWQSVHDDKIDLLDDLFNIILEDVGFDIHDHAVFTTNYDICIDESFSKWHERINDGFDKVNGFQVFNNELLEYKRGPKLFKLHGSVNWIELDDGRIIKTEDRIPFNKLDYRRKKIKQRILIYPMLEKIEYQDNRINMIPYLKKWVQNVDLIISVGFSYRDKLIRDTIFENANKNTALIHISPNADSERYKILFEKFPGKFIPLPRSYPWDNYALDVLNILWKLYRFKDEMSESNEKNKNTV